MSKLVSNEQVSFSWASKGWLHSGYFLPLQNKPKHSSAHATNNTIYSTTS